MKTAIRTLFVALALCAASAARMPSVGAEPMAGATPSLPSVASNDNTVAGGRLERGVLHISLVARRGLFYPDGPGTLGLPIQAFGEVGKPLQIPGPFLHVPVGTHVDASIRNELDHELTIRGFAPASERQVSFIRIRPHATKRVSFVLDRAGAFGYYGADEGETIRARVFEDAELSGAIVVERPRERPLDHTFVLGLYAPVKMKDGSPNFEYFLETINGRAFPATERLTYERGHQVRWAVFNASSMNHPMHLHGFYYRLDGRDSYDQVTHAFFPGEAEELSWTADRAGSWMFHCHIDDHITRHAPLRDMRAGKADPNLTIEKRFHLPNEPMGGMVIAIRVLPLKGDRLPNEPKSPRHLDLAIVAHDRPHEPYLDLPQDTLVLTDGPRTIRSSGNLGPPIILTRGDPVAIAVTNRTREQTSIHWHGVALEDSYYDGGSGMGMPMHGERVSPPIDPGATFVARFTPPDAGTFMYHAHMDDGWQLAEGADGPLIVLPPGAVFDPATDHVVMISESYEKAGEPYVAIGGSLTPAPISMVAGVPQRLRFAELSLGGENLVVSLSEGSHVLRWTPIAKDGRDFPVGLQRETVATQALTIGETRDFRFTPNHPGILTLGVYDLDDRGMLVATERIDVTPVRIGNQKPGTL